mmetsp:Transcript_5616/g.20222  ORF Transcript_5616/g.20222 Transcript_5616/m.20222 type:complete len:320 (-) Transcript_5616:1938-2897(-)
MPQPLVVHDPNVDLRLHLLASDPAHELLRAVPVEPAPQQLVPKALDEVRGAAPSRGKWRRVLELPSQGAGLGRQALQYHPDGHPGREAVGVEDDVRANSRRLAPRHIDVPVQVAQDSLLAVPAGELVPNHRVTVEPQLEVDLVHSLGPAANDGDLIHHSHLLALQNVVLAPAVGLVDHAILVVPGPDGGPDVRKAVSVDPVHILVLPGLQPSPRALRRPFPGAPLVEAPVGDHPRELVPKPIPWRFPPRVVCPPRPLHPERSRLAVHLHHLALVHRPVREAPLHAGLVDDHGVLHVVPCVGQDRDDGICPGRVLINLVI